ncbi:MAG TPA: CHAT domain-containing protein, partial [Myxococcaceae bacterium]|nr:CHAT domain-containing protein [Myxococcaceae bacterium]
KDYLDFVHLRSTLDDAGWRRWLAQARKAGADDLVLGALVLTGRSREELGDLHRIVSATHSPWFEMLEAAEQAKAAYAKGDATSSEQLVLGAIGRCDAERVRYRCLMLQEYLVGLHLEAHRLQAAQATALKALALARPPGNEWGQVSVLMRQLGDTERLRSRFALARAYYEEAELGTPADHCETRRDLLLNLAELYVVEGRPEDARREALAAGMCPTSPLTGQGLGVHLDLYRIGTPVLTEDALRREIEGFRQQPGIRPGDRLFADFAEARLVIDREPARGEALLRSVIKEAAQRRKDMTAMKTSSYAYTMLLVDAARRGAYDAMAPLLVEEQGGREVPATCAVAIARDDFRLAVAVRGARGDVAGSYTERAPPGERTPRLGPDLLLHLAGCPEVRVLAQPPLAGIARLLPTDLAWSYQITSGANGPSPAADSCAAGTPQEARSPYRRVVVASSSPPNWLGLPSLRDWDAPESTSNGEVLLLTGAEATPSRVLSELPRATEIQFHVHAVTDRTKSDAPVLALTENSAHIWALRAEDLRPGSLRCHPLVLLADCHAGELADWMHAAWGLPTAFLAAGAGAVVASPEDVPDREATLFVDGVVTRIRGGVTPAKAVSAEKRAWLERQPESWVTDVIVFQ